MRALALLAELYHAVGSTIHAQRLYDVLAPFAGENVPQDSSDSGGCASYYLGLLATTLERWDDAEQQFATALERNERWGFRLYVATRWLAGPTCWLGARSLATATTRWSCSTARVTGDRDRRRPAGAAGHDTAHHPHAAPAGALSAA